MAELTHADIPGIVLEVKAVDLECAMAKSAGMLAQRCEFTQQIGSDPANTVRCGAVAYKECTYCGPLCQSDWERGCMWQSEHEEV